MHYKQTDYGFEWGSAKIERLCMDEKKGWVYLRVKTPKGNVELYITKSGKIEVYDATTPDKKEMK